jgi:hypothetical protein
MSRLVLTMTEIKIYKSPWKAIKLILLTSPFVAIALYDIITHSIKMPPALSWFCLCFFGLGIPLGLFNLLDRRPEMILNQDGIFDRQSYGVFNKRKDRGFVRWDSITNAYLKEYQPRTPQGLPTSKQKYVCLSLKESAKNHISKSSIKLSKFLGIGDYTIPLLNLRNFDEQKFIQLIKLMAHSTVAEKQKLLNDFKS